MGFVDEAVISVRSGDGGKGCVSFRREKYIPKGGPDGGDGGNGGHVIFRTTPRLHTLADFNYKNHFKASNGQHGKGKNQTGKDGRDVVIEVPIGTIIQDHDSGDIIADTMAHAFDYIDAPPVRITLPDWPMPYSPALEDTALPSVERIVAAVTDGR